MVEAGGGIAEIVRPSWADLNWNPRETSLLRRCSPLAVVHAEVVVVPCRQHRAGLEQLRRKDPGGRGRQVCPRSRLDDPRYPVVLVEDNAGLTHGQ